MTQLHCAFAGDNMQTQPVSFGGAGAAIDAIIESMPSDARTDGKDGGPIIGRIVMARAAAVCITRPKVPPTLW